MTHDTLDLGPEPVAERQISDVETLKALSDPLRLRILELMTTGADQAFTVKRLAAALEVSQTKLYHHINLLVERELIRPVGTRVVSGIIETRYRVAQLSVKLDHRLLAGDSPALHHILTTVFDGARDDIERGIQAGTIDLDEDSESFQRIIISKGVTRLSAARAAEFRTRLNELVHAFDDEQPGVEADPYGFVLSFYPMAGIPAEEPTDEPTHG